MEDVSARTHLLALNGRRFRLEEYTLAETGRFMDAINAAVEADASAWQAAGETSLEGVYERVAGSLEGVFELILRYPEDGLGPADADFISAIKLTQRRRLLELQSELNHLEDVEFGKKVWAVLLLVSAWRTASGFAPLSGSALTPSPSTTEASTLKLWSLRGLFARLSTTCASLLGRNGGKTSAPSL